MFHKLIIREIRKKINLFYYFLIALIVTFCIIRFKKYKIEKYSQNGGEYGITNIVAFHLVKNPTSKLKRTESNSFDLRGKF